MNGNITEQLARFRRRFWLLEEFEDWYGISGDLLEDELVFSIDTLEAPPSFLQGRTERVLDHWRFEIILQRRELLPINTAAASWAISVDDFNRVADAIHNNHAFTPGEHFEAPGIVRESFMEAVASMFPAMRTRVFSSVDSYISALHGCFSSSLGVEVETIYDRAGEILQSRHVAQKRDCLTGEPVGIAHQIPLELRKPLELESDICSWVTYSRFADELDGLAILPSHLTFEIQEQLKNAID